MKRIVMLLTVCLLRFTISNGQDTPAPDLNVAGPDVVPPSPTVASLMRFEEVPISHYSGQPDISIPIYGKQLAPGLSMSLALRYSTMGVQVFERSGWVGTGWALQAGGVISRTVRGLPDDMLIQNNRPHFIGLWANSEFWTYDAMTPAQKGEFKWKVKGSSLEKLDSEMDMYQFSFPGGSGRFVVVRENGQYVPKLITKDQLVKIEANISNIGFMGPCLRNDGEDCLQFDYPHIDNFRVTDRNGYVYEFTAKEYKQSVPIYRYIPQFNDALADYSIPGADSRFYAISAWHLTSIKTSNGELLATIDYALKGQAYPGNVTNTFTHVMDFGGADPSNAYNQQTLKPRLAITHHEVDEQTLVPTSMVFRDNTKISFGLKAGGHPETGGAVLEYINLYRRATDTSPVKSYRFHTSTVAERLWLDGVDEIAGDITLPYTIAYQNKAGLPAHGTVATGFPETDIWGYKKIAEDALDRSVKMDGLISSITYPTGGSKEFEFEEHTYSYVGSDQVDVLEAQQDPANSIGRHAVFEVNDYFTSQESEAGITIGTFGPVDFDQEVDITLLDFDINGTSGIEQEGTETILFRLYNSEGEPIANHDVTQGQFSLFLPAGETFDIRVHYLTPDPFNLFANVRIDYSESIELPSSTGQQLFVSGGGFRIKSIDFTDEGQELRHFGFNYNFQPDGQGNIYSSGAVDGASGTLSNEYTQRVNKYLFSTETNIETHFSPRSILYHIRKIGSTNASLTKGGYVGYQRVTETGREGTTEYSFTTARHHPSPRSSYIFPFAPKPELDYKRGLMTSKRDYDRAGRLVKSVTNDYGFVLDTVDLQRSLFLVDWETCPWAQFFDTYALYAIGEPENMPTCKETINNPHDLPCIDRNIIPALPCDELVSHLNLLSDRHQFGWAKLLSTTEKYHFHEPLPTQTVNTGAGQLVPDIQYRESFHLKFTRYDYNTENYLPSATEQVVQEGNSPIFYRTEFTYPIGSDVSGVSNALLNRMRELNMVTLPLETATYRALEDPGNSLNAYEPLVRVRNTFREFEVGQMLLETVSTAKGNNPLEERAHYYRYNAIGNVEEYAQEDGVRMAYKWGFNGTLPVLQLQHFSYAGLSTDENNLLAGPLDLDGLSNAQVEGILSPYRSSFSDAFISAFGHDPVYGMTIQIDPNGRVSRYQYDALGRAQRLEDHDGNILQEFEYNYQNQ